MTTADTVSDNEAPVFAGPCRLPLVDLHQVRCDDLKRCGIAELRAEHQMIAEAGIPYPPPG